MKSKALLISGSVLVAAWMSSGTVQAQSSGTKGETIHPPLTGPAGSIGGSKSERGTDNVPLSKGSPESGTVEMGKSGGTADSIMAVQRALKDKGYDPGPIDGKMNSRTQAALKSFQSASNLQATGVLDSESASKLGLRDSGSSKANSPANGSSSTRGTTKSSNTTVGKDSDQPNQEQNK